MRKKQFNVMLSDETRAGIKELARIWERSEAEVIRILVRNELAEPSTEGIKIPPVLGSPTYQPPPGDFNGVAMLRKSINQTHNAILDAVAEPGKGKVSFERERKPQVHVKNPADTPDDENERWRKAAKEARENGGLPSVVRRPIRPKGSKL